MQPINSSKSDTAASDKENSEPDADRLGFFLGTELVLFAMALVLPFMPSKSPGGPLIVIPNSLGDYMASVLIAWLIGNGIVAVLFLVVKLYSDLTDTADE